MVLVSAQTNATAVLAAINAQFTSTRAYDLDAVPTPRPSEYVEVTVSRRFGGTQTLAARSSLVGYRVTCRAVSHVKVANVRNALEKCRTALEYQRLTVGTEQTTPIQFETEDPAAYDDGWFSGLASFTFTVPEES